MASNEQSLLLDRADARIRTADPFITSEVLYQLSYVGGMKDCSLAARSATPRLSLVSGRWPSR
jgi:hypothetical protein